MKPTHYTRVSLISFLIGILCMASSQSMAAFDGQFEGELKDAWLTGKAETVLALNEHLNRYSIGARVNESVVTLSGTVSSEIDKSLASELMNGIADIRSVRNDLKIKENLAATIEPSKASSRSSFSRWINDLTTTAVIRSRLVSNGNVSGLAINVETRQDVVTLKGQVGSEQESALAEEIAKNSGGVMKVNNDLMIVANK